VCSYLPVVEVASRVTGFPVAGTPAGTVAIRAAGLRVRGKTVTVEGQVPSAGEETLFCWPVLSVPAAVRRDGAILADAWLPDLVRLGGLERHLGDGVIEAIVDATLGQGRLRPRQRRRIMSYPLVIRLMIAMGLMPDGSYCEALSRLAGLLADVPFVLQWHIPTEKVITQWRLLIPADVMEDIFWQAGPLIADDEPSAVLLAGMPAAAADGMLVNLPDTAENRAFFGSTGTADDSSPFPQLRVVALTARAGRAMLGAILGQSSAGEQTLLKRLVKRRPDLFAGRVTCFGRNFPGYELITAILDAGGHVVARMKEGISLDFEDGPDRGWLPDGSRLSWLNAPSGKKEDRLPVRVTEHNVTMPSGDGEEEGSRRPAPSSPPCWITRRPPLTRYGRRISPGGARRRPRSGRTRPRSPVRGTAPPAPCCDPAARGWSSPKPGPGWPAPSWSGPARPPRCAARRPPPARCAAAAGPSSPPTRNPSPPASATRSAPWQPRRSRRPRPCRRSPPRRTPPPAPPAPP
jgi:hypothetical protein